MLCRPKDQGVLGVIDLEVQNKCFLSKWIVNLLNNEGTWQSLLRNKYLSSSLKEEVQAKPNDSHFLRGLMKIKEEILACGDPLRLKVEKKTRFWEDTGWTKIHSKITIHQFTTYRQPHVSVVNVLSSEPLNILFRGHWWM
jgi:hypothetical protein